MGAERRKRLFVPAVIVVVFKEGLLGKAMLEINHVIFRDTRSLVFQYCSCLPGNFACKQASHTMKLGDPKSS